MNKETHRRAVVRTLSALGLGVALLTAGCRREPAPGPRSSARVNVKVPTQAEMVKEFVRLDREAGDPPADPSLRREYANLRLYLRKAEVFVGVPQLPDFALPMLYRDIMHARASLRILRNAQVPSPSLGYREEGFYAPNDDSYQPFVRYLPLAARAGGPLPLIVFLHGYTPELNLLNWSGLATGLAELAEKEGFAILKPFARSNTDFQAIGEQDVLEAMREMQERYPIDPERIVLAGYSMGGLGAWSIAAHHPHLFAGVLVVSGRGDYYYWHGLKRENLPIHKQRFADSEFAAPLAVNLRHLPFSCFHGSADTLIPVGEARNIVRAAQAAGASVRYVELDGADHWILEEVLARPDVRAWLRERRRRVPVEFEYTTYDARFTRAHWLRLDGLRPREFPARISVRADGPGLRVRTRGIRRVIVRKDLMPVPARGRPVVADGDVELTTLAGPVVDGVQPPARGPLRSAFLSPFLFVQVDPPRNDAARFPLRGAVRAWRYYSKTTPRVEDEKSLTAAHLRDYNIFLFGEPENSPRIREVLAKAPVDITAEHYRIGNREFPRRGNGMLLVYRSPWNPRRLAVVESGLPWGRGIPENHVYDFPPDFIVYTAQRDSDGSNRALCAGFFDEHWQIAPSLLYEAGTRRR